MTTGKCDKKKEVKKNTLIGKCDKKKEMKKNTLIGKKGNRFHNVQDILLFFEWTHKDHKTSHPISRRPQMQNCTGASSILP